MNFLEPTESSSTAEELIISYNEPSITKVNYCDGITSDYIYDLYTRGLLLKKNILINIEYECDDFVVSHDFLNLWINGKNLKLIEIKLAKQIADLFNKLRSLNKNKLGPYPQKCLDYLKEYIQEVN